MHIFLRGFVRARQKSARTGLSGGGLPPRLTGLFWADLEAALVAPGPPVCDCGGWCAFANWDASGRPPTPPIACWPTTGGVAVEGVAAIGWAPGSRAGGPNAEPPSPPALIGRWCRAPCFPCYDGLSFFSSCGDVPQIAVLLPRRWRRSTPIDVGLRDAPPRAVARRHATALGCYEAPSCVTCDEKVEVHCRKRKREKEREGGRRERGEEGEGGGGRGGRRALLILMRVRVCGAST